MEKKILITGAYGQLGQALAKLFPTAELIDRDTLDISSSDVFTARNWADYSIILNAAAYTAVDLAETDGRADAWSANAVAVGNLAKIATQNDLILAHVSTDYVFDGTKENHTEDEPFSPLGVYGQTKAAGDIAAATTPKYYILRTSWVIGKGNNFVKTMKQLAEKGVKPSVVDDQVGRLTFTDDLAAGIKHLIESASTYGTYNLSNDGVSASWAEIAKNIYEKVGLSPSDVTPVTTTDYYNGKTGIAPRPLSSTLNLDKIKAAGFTARDWKTALDEYWKELENEENK